MYSGKSSRLIEISRAAEHKASVFKPSIDARYDRNRIVTHDNVALAATPVSSASEVRLMLDQDVAAIFDEVQFMTPPFFDSDFPLFVRGLLSEGRTVVCAGLDMDFHGCPFPVTAALLAMADVAEKRTALCTITGRPASKTLKKKSHHISIEIGGAELYEARCNTRWRRTTISSYTDLIKQSKSNASDVDT